VVVVGAGFGGLAAAKRLEKAPVEVTIVDRHNFHTFLPLLYQVATAGLNPADVGYVVRGLFRRERQVLFRKAAVEGVDWDAGEVRVTGEPPIPFDHLVVAAGSTTNYFSVDGAEEHAFPMYTMEDAIRVRNHMLALFEAADGDPALVDQGALNFVVVGGGPTGVEVAGALVELFDKVLEQDFHDLDVHRARVILVEQADQLLTPFSGRSQRYARRTLTRRGVEVRLGTAVRRIAVDRVELSSGEVIPTRLVLWAAGVKASPLAAALGVEQGRGGRVVVESDLSATSPTSTTATAVASPSSPRWRCRAASTPPSRCWPTSPGGPARRSATTTRARWPPSVAGRPWPSSPCPGRRAAPACCRAASPGWRGWGCTSCTWSVCATGSRCSPTGPGTT
jgi:NADH dehydrogenase